MLPIYKSTVQECSSHLRGAEPEIVLVVISCNFTIFSCNVCKNDTLQQGACCFEVSISMEYSDGFNPDPETTEMVASKPEFVHKDHEIMESGGWLKITDHEFETILSWHSNCPL